MELLLNLAWLLLALPAYWLWQGSRSTRRERQFTSLQCLLALVSVLVLLFPVVSATDDLHAMRTEMEESAPGKRTTRQAGTDRCSICNSRFQGPAILLASAAYAALDHQQWVTPHQLPLGGQAAPSILCIGRAPPSSRLA